jgi:hypothetical protein
LADLGDFGARGFGERGGARLERQDRHALELVVDGLVRQVNAPFLIRRMNMLLRELSRPRAVLLAIGLLSLISPQARAAGGITITPPPNVSVPENPIPNPYFQITFQVTNTTGFDLLLDYALCIITPGPPDTDDKASFAGAGGSNGLASGALTIANKATGLYTYNIITPNQPLGPDFGNNRVDFYVEYQINTGTTAPPTISSAQGFVVFEAQNSVNYTEDPTALNKLQNFTPLNPGETLFTGNNPAALIFADSTVADNDSPNIRVNDVPEPSSIVMACTSVLFLFGYGVRGRNRGDSSIGQRAIRS